MFHAEKMDLAAGSVAVNMGYESGIHQERTVAVKK